MQKKREEIVEKVGKQGCWNTVQVYVIRGKKKISFDSVVVYIR